MTLIALTTFILLISPSDEPKPKDQKPVPLAIPKPEFSPHQAIKTVFDALKTNDTPRENAGIETAFNFASPSNKKVTGPLPKFIAMVKSPNYETMVDHKSAEVFTNTRVQGDIAVQRVRVISKSGKIVTFDFLMSKDKETACWMTDGVVIVPPVEA